jgi:hypothetical protein
VFWIAKAESAKSSSSAGKRCGLGWRTLCVGSQVHGKISETIIAGTDERSLSGVALVSVMESSKLRNRDDAPAFWLLQGSRLRSVLGQR